jgi:hypothetical protein
MCRRPWPPIQEQKASVIPGRQSRQLVLRPRSRASCRLALGCSVPAFTQPPRPRSYFRFFVTFHDAMRFYRR